MQMLLMKPLLDAEEAQVIVSNAAKVVNYMKHHYATAIPTKPADATLPLGRRFVLLDCLVSAIHVLETAMDPESWWDVFIHGIPTEFEVAKPPEAARTQHELLTDRLTGALRMLRKRTRAPRSQTLLLKNALFGLRGCNTQYGFFLNGLKTQGLHEVD